MWNARLQTRWGASWNQDCRERYKKPQIVDDTTLMAEDEEELNSVLVRVKEESEKAGLKLNIKKQNKTKKQPKIRHLVPSLHGK